MAVEFHGGVPGGIRAVEQPGEMGGEGEHGPAADAEGACEVKRAGAGADDEVHVGHDGGGVGEVVDFGAEVEDLRGQGLFGEVVAAGAHLQDGEVHVRDLEEFLYVDEAG